MQAGSPRHLKSLGLPDCPVILAGLSNSSSQITQTQAMCVGCDPCKAPPACLKQGLAPRQLVTLQVISSVPVGVAGLSHTRVQRMASTRQNEEFS